MRAGIAVELLQAAKSGDTAAFGQARARWYANADDIADFLAAANPKYWPRDAMRAGHGCAPGPDPSRGRP